MKTIGVLGGLGPQATMDFEVRLHHVAQQLIPHKANSGYPPMVVYYFREAPVVMPADGSMPTTLPPANPRLLDASRWLGTCADFLVITSNGVHVWQEEIEQAAGRKVLSMIDAVVDEVKRRRLRRVGIVDFRPPNLGLYPPMLDRLGVAWEVLSPDLTKALAVSVFAVDEGRLDSKVTQPALDALDYIRARHVDGIILACTEIPLMLGDWLDAPDIINPAQLLAESAVRHAMA